VPCVHFHYPLSLFSESEVKCSADILQIDVF
jgi:hypothetical protein